MSNVGFPADFLDAMDRHWQDAELLRRNQRLANADHLYGLSAECGLKAIMRKLGMEMENNVPRRRCDRQHINRLWDRYESYRSRSHHRMRNARFSLRWQHNPFANWHVSGRYANRDHCAEDRLEEHRSGAKDVKGLVARLEKQGLLP